MFALKSDILDMFYREACDFSISSINSNLITNETYSEANSLPVRFDTDVEGDASSFVELVY